MSEFSKTEHAQKTPVRIANESQCTGAVRISTINNTEILHSKVLLKSNML